MVGLVIFGAEPIAHAADGEPQELAVLKGGQGSGTVTSSIAGIACGAKCSAKFAQGSRVSLRAVAAPGSVFLGWGPTSNVSHCAPTQPCPLRMDGLQVVSAIFDTTTFVVSVHIPSGNLTEKSRKGGSVKSSPPGIDCPGAACSASFPWGTKVTLRATPDLDTFLSDWGGSSRQNGVVVHGCSASKKDGLLGDCTILGKRDPQSRDNVEKIRPLFWPKPALRVQTAGNPGANAVVTSAPAGIHCGRMCEAGFDPNSSVTLTATPSAGWEFMYWGPGFVSVNGVNIPTPCGRAGNTNSCTVKMGTEVGYTSTINDSSTGLARYMPPIVAYFRRQRQVSVEINRQSGSDGTVISLPGRLLCGTGFPATACTATFDHDANITLVPTALPGSRFKWFEAVGGGNVAPCSWPDPNSPAGSCAVRPDAPQQFRAVFMPAVNSPMLRVDIAPHRENSFQAPGRGRVTTTYGRQSTSASGEVYIAAGTAVTVTAQPEAGSRFMKWASFGPCASVGENPTCSFTMGANDMGVKAVFVPVPPDPQLTVEKTVGDRGASGFVTSAPQGIDCGPACTARFATNTSITLTATPLAGSVFASWGAGPCARAGATCTLRKGADAETLRPTFRPAR